MKHTNTKSDNNKWERVKSCKRLVKYKPSGVFFARFRVKGKLYRTSLKTTSLSVAEMKLTDFRKEKRDSAPESREFSKWTMGDVIDLFLKRLNAQQDIRESSKQTRRACLTVLLKQWPKFRDTAASKITKEDCLEWAERLSHYSPSVYNNTVGTLVMLFDLAVEKGARANNPAKVVGKKRALPKELHLPSKDQFEQFLKEMETLDHSRYRQDAADLVRFLAYGGFRITESASILWGDCDFAAGKNGIIRVRITKNGKPRSVPMIPQMRELLLRLKSECPEATASDPVMLVNYCQKSMTRAASRVPGMARITHHDLRHAFATRCLESGVDIPTVSKWLGHQDGGALAMRVYGHLRDEHSDEMASKVIF